MHGKKLQFANGSMYREDGEDVWIHDCKLDRLAQLVDELAGEPLLVAYTFKFDLKRILSRFPDALVFNRGDSRANRRLWNTGKVPLMLAHRASVGHGMNLQHGGHHLCEYGLTTDLELYEQFLARLDRPGQKHKVRHYVIAARGTIDDDVRPMYLEPKAEVQDRVLARVAVPTRPTETHVLI